MSFRSFGVALFLLLLTALSSAEAEVPRSVEEGWAWPIAVIPPSDGWDSPSGRSVAPVVEYAQGLVNDSIEGIKEHDVFFRLESGDVFDSSDMARWRKEGFLAVISFADERVNRVLADSWRQGDPVLLLADDSSTVLRDEKEVVKAGLFSLDLHDSYVTRAAVETAVSILPPASEVGLLSDRLAEYLSRGARAVSRGLREGGLNSQVFWVAGGGTDSFSMMAQEMLGFGSDMVVVWMTDMAAREFYRQLRVLDGSVPVWSGGASLDGIVGLEGIMTADQDLPLRLDKAIKTLKTDVWDATRVRVPDSPLAAKAYACCQWVFQGLKDVQKADPEHLAKVMASTKGIPLGSENLEINPVTHRPSVKKVAVIRAKKGKWIQDEILSLSESRAGYYFGTPKDER
ncbi:MAG: ABC transporter substrate-binding protein [Synergistota bacterium]|nr:ABC transporter substrate-binding protein [Synergistota bacterium]